MKIALYKDVKYAGTLVLEVDEFFEGSENYVRISEIIEVDFLMLPAKEVVPKEMAILDKAEDELRAKFDQAISSLADKRSKLLALTHQEAE